MDLTEQIARALAEAEHGADAWEHLIAMQRSRYLALAQVVLPPFIAAERERCAMIARRHYNEIARDAGIHQQEGNDDSLRRCQARMRSASQIEAAIRSQP